MIASGCHVRVRAGFRRFAGQGKGVVRYGSFTPTPQTFHPAPTRPRYPYPPTQARHVTDRRRNERRGRPSAHGPRRVSVALSGTRDSPRIVDTGPALTIGAGQPLPCPGTTDAGATTCAAAGVARGRARVPARARCEKRL